MTWNWQHKDWPNYIYQIKQIEAFERLFLKNAGVFLGILQCLDAQGQEQIKIELLSDEALKTSAIEGEYLNRESLQASLKRAFGLTAEKHYISPAEKGVAQMMLDVYRDYAAPLTADVLFSWHTLLMNGRTNLETIGAYRTHAEPMLIVSGGTREPIIHFEAPPSKHVKPMMKNYIQWFNESSPNGKKPLPALERAAIAHIYFESIHPFEDGNGRIGRALAEKALSQCLNYPSLIALSTIMEQNKKSYYAALQTTNHSLDVSSWMSYFSETTLKAQQHSKVQIEFLFKKAKFFDKFDDQLNERQRKVLLRMFREGVAGFEGGLSAEKYIAITRASRSTVTRDLKELLEMGALTKQGELRYSRYFLRMDSLETYR